MAEKPKILVIDDDEAVRESCTHILVRGGYEIRIASNGAKGLALLKSFLPHVVLVDLKMPDISGFDVLEQIIAFDPTIVTIVVTGFSSVDSAVESMKKGAYDFLAKPFALDELRRLVQRGLEHRKLLLESIALRKEKELLLEHFAAIVSHELKSPLSAVQQNLFALSADLEDILNEEQKAKMERLQIRIEDMVSMINTWLRVISADINKIRDEFAPTSIKKVMEKALECVEAHAMRKDIALKNKSSASLPQVLGHEGALVEVFTNILNNAIKYSRMSTEISIFCAEADGEIVITITDQGEGIAAAELPHIFDDFYSGKERTEGDRGNGVGLSLSKRIVDVHDGKIFVKSKLGKGSSFSVLLPVLAN